jgi:hypothetical protein
LTEDQLRRLMIHQFGVSIGEEMSRYVLQCLMRRDVDEIAIMGGDARTGIAVRRLIPRQQIEQAADHFVA